MNAIDYFKKYGLADSKKHLDWMVRVGARRDIHGWFMDDLKRLVESHDLVDAYGGISTIKTYIKISANKNTKLFLSLKQAIADVESCQ